LWVYHVGGSLATGEINAMKSQQLIWKRVTADWNLAFLLALPMFAVTMWFGISRGYQDIGLFALLMALYTFHVAELTILAFRRIRELRGVGGDRTRI
jgi:hypothetical protein